DGPHKPRDNPGRSKSGEFGMSTPCPHCGTPVEASTAVSNEIPSSTSSDRLRQGQAPEPGTSAITHPQKADVGVLFVHGIGQPGRGDTLIRFGDPLCSWIKQWLDGAKSQTTQAAASTPPPTTDASFAGCEKAILPTSNQTPQAAPILSGVTFDANDGILRQRMDEGEAPPRASVNFGATVNGVAHSNAWLLAESRWADAFPTTRFR